MSITNEDKKEIVEFSSTLLSNQYHFSFGGTAIFFNGRYRTDVKEEIDELRAEVNKGNPYIISYRTVEALKEDPLANLKAQLRQEMMAEFQAADARATNPENDMGGNTMTPGAFGAASTNEALATLAAPDAQPKIAMPFVKIGK